MFLVLCLIHSSGKLTLYAFHSLEKNYSHTVIYSDTNVAALRHLKESLFFFFIYNVF